MNTELFQERIMQVFKNTFFNQDFKIVDIKMRGSDYITINIDTNLSPSTRYVMYTEQEINEFTDEEVAVRMLKRCSVIGNRPSSIEKTNLLKERYQERFCRILHKQLDIDFEIHLSHDAFGTDYIFLVARFIKGDELSKNHIPFQLEEMGWLTDNEILSEIKRRYELYHNKNKELN